MVEVRVRTSASATPSRCRRSSPLLRCRFPNLHVTQSIKRPQLGAPGGRVAKTVQFDGAVRCRGRVVAKSTDAIG